MNKLLCPSMMCADFGNLSEEIHSLEEAGADILHIDVMDGMFVPNFALGAQDLRVIAEHASVPVDAHLMIMNPGAYVERFAELGADIIYIHPESEIHASRTLDKIIGLGKKAGIALNPGTIAETVKPLLSLVSHVLVMTVNPGYAGQKYLPFVDEKIEELLRLKEKYDYEIIIDGACSPNVIRDLSTKGVKGFVLGTAALFGKGRPYAQIIRELRSSIE